MASNSSDDDFTFPATTADSPPRFIDSPPLWWTTPNSPIEFEPENRKEKEFGDGNGQNLSSSKDRSFIQRRKSFSSYYDDGCDDQEEEMDMLWEDLNEEFSRNIGKMAKISDVSSSPGRDVRVSCVKAIKLSRPNGQLKKPNVLVFIKVLKKFFVLHNSSRRPKKKHAW